MKILNEQQIQSNWNKLRQIINDTFDGERLVNLNKMYDYFEDRMCMAPASGKEHIHNAQAGGYVEHVIHVTTSALQIKELWEKNGASINFTDEELVFAALHHDLGKVGDLADDHYVPNDSDWHIKNQGKYYVNNPTLQFMTPPDRGIWILNQFGIKITVNEMIGIKLTDGLYDEGNVQYLKSYAPEKKLKSNMPHILHQADMTTTRIEYEMWKRGDLFEDVQPVGDSDSKETVGHEEKSEKSTRAHDLFKELFDD